MLIYAFLAFSYTENVELELDSLFYCTYFVYLLQYLVMLAIHGAHELRQGCFLIFLGAPSVVRTPATLSTAINGL